MGRRARHTLAALGLVAALAAGALMGPVEAVALGCIAGSLACMAMLRESSASARPTPPDQRPHTDSGEPDRTSPEAGAAPVAPAPTREAEPAPQAPADEASAGDAPAPDTPAPDMPAPAPSHTPRHMAPAAPSFSLDDLARELYRSDDPYDALRERVGDIRTREAERGPAAVLPVELYLARLLEEAGLLSKDDGPLPATQVVRPRHSRMFYLRCPQDRLSYGAHLRVLRIEAALNALLLASERVGDLERARLVDLYRANQRLLAGICGQSPAVDTADWSYLAMPWQAPVGPSERGEWAVRQALSNAIESVRVPFRLEADFRANVAEGDVAIEFRATPSRVMWHSAHVPGMGIVDTTATMRRREASKYAARLGLLLAGHAFGSSRRVRRVWVSAIHETPSRHQCLYSGCMGRRDFSRLDLSHVTDPIGALRTLGVRLLEAEEVLSPVEPVFYLEDERFCPPVRHDLWHLSERVLPASAALSLGTSRVSGLLIHEELPRTLAADAIVRGMAPAGDRHATQRSVEAVMGVARSTSDLSVWSAAERVMAHLVDGTLATGDPEALQADLIEGDALSRAVRRAHGLLSEQRPAEALDLLRGTLDSLDRQGTYRDTPAVAYRSFGSFAERVMFNRSAGRDRRSVVLVPDAYLEAHLLVSGLLSSLAAQEEDGAAHRQEALAHARRAVEVAPLGAPANLGLAACLEGDGRHKEAEELLRGYLEGAFHPQAMGFAYLRMASVQWNLGDHEACQACYQRCVQVFPGLLPVVIAECHALLAEGATFVEQMDGDEVERVLRSRNIPLAPTERTSYILYDGATASVDAEVFPVARDLVWVLEALTGDDVIRGIRSSLEREPDA